MSGTIPADDVRPDAPALCCECDQQGGDVVMWSNWLGARLRRFLLRRDGIWIIHADCLATSSDEDRAPRPRIETHLNAPFFGTWAELDVLLDERTEVAS